MLRLYCHYDSMWQPQLNLYIDIMQPARSLRTAYDWLRDHTTRTKIQVWMTTARENSNTGHTHTQLYHCITKKANSESNHRTVVQRVTLHTAYWKWDSCLKFQDVVVIYYCNHRGCFVKANHDRGLVISLLRYRRGVKLECPVPFPVLGVQLYCCFARSAQ